VKEKVVGMAAQNMAPVIIKRKKVISGGGHHGGAWKVAMCHSLVCAAFYTASYAGSPQRVSLLDQMAFIKPCHPIMRCIARMVRDLLTSA